jgi:hypothetical protein
VYLCLCSSFVTGHTCTYRSIPGAPTSTNKNRYYIRCKALALYLYNLAFFSCTSKVPSACPSLQKARHAEPELHRKLGIQQLVHTLTTSSLSAVTSNWRRRSAHIPTHSVDNSTCRKHSPEIRSSSSNQNGLFSFSWKCIIGDETQGLQKSADSENRLILKFGKNM